MASEQRYTGIVGQWNDGKGFGFIRRAGESGRGLFVHASDIMGRRPRTLSLGDAVEFEIEPAERGPRCVRVRVVGPGAGLGASEGIG